MVREGGGGGSVGGEKNDFEHTLCLSSFCASCVEVVSASVSSCHANVPGVSALKAAFRLTTVLVSLQRAGK